MIAFADAGGLGLPDRDYYTKTDAKSQETRQKYVEHVQHMFELLGEAPAAAKAHAQTVMDIETALAKASLTRVEKRDPYKLFHKMTPAQLQALTPSFHWAAYFETSRDAGHFGDQRQRARVFQGGADAAAIPQAGRLEDLSALAPGPLQGFLSAGGLRQRQFRFLQQVPARRGTDAAALEALRAARGWRSRRGAGPGIRRQDLRARDQAKRRSP